MKDDSSSHPTDPIAGQLQAQSSRIIKKKHFTISVRRKVTDSKIKLEVKDSTTEAQKNTKNSKKNTSDGQPIQNQNQNQSQDQNQNQIQTDKQKTIEVKIANKPTSAQVTLQSNLRGGASHQEARSANLLMDELLQANNIVPAIVHPNFDPKQNPPDPARPLTDIPEPYRRSAEQINRIYADALSLDDKNKQDAVQKGSNTASQGVSNKNVSKETSKSHVTKNSITNCMQPKLSDVNDNLENASKWQVIQSPELAEHLALLQAGGLIQLPDSFYHNKSKQPLLDPLTDLTLVDMGEIQQVLSQHPNLTRQGLRNKPVNQKHSKTGRTTSNHDKKSPNTLSQHSTIAQINSRQYCAEWEAILYPQRFDDGDDLATDIMSTSIAVHVLKQCGTRQSINLNYTIDDIVNHIRSYVLSQCQQLPHMRQHLTHTPIYAGHVIIAAELLGWQVHINEQQQLHVNISSRCGLFARYPVLADYYVDGWQ